MSRSRNSLWLCIVLTLLTQTSTFGQAAVIAQDRPSVNEAAADNEVAVNKEATADEETAFQVIQNLFDAMRKGDTTQMRALFHPDNKMLSSFTTRDGKEMLHEGTLDDFIKAVGDGHEEVWDERISDPIVKTDANMATIWAPYHFYLGEYLSHCGVNAFTLVRTDGNWQILHLLDTRKRKGCE